VTTGAGRLRYVVRTRETSGEGPVQIDRRVGSVSDLQRAQDSSANVWAEAVYPTSAVATPNDPLYPSQDETFTAPGDDGFRAAWEVSTGAPTVSGDAPPIIAIVDSGVDVTHPDLAKNLWTNPGEITGNEIDDDRNGFIDDIHGADIISPGTPPDDEYYHGTAVAGVAAARGDDGQGITGVAWISRIMAVRVLDEDGTGDTGQLAKGILYAVANGAQVINVSITSDARTRAVDDAIDVAQRANVVIVAAAGNGGRDLGEQPAYPASSTNPAMISVAATSSRGALAGWSNFGRTGVDIAAPGTDLLTTLPNGSYAAFSGTSAASPVVAGTIALMRAVQPLAGLSQIRSTVLDSAERSAVPVRSGELRAGGALAAFAPLDINKSSLANPKVSYITVRSSIVQGKGIHHRVRIAWKLNRSTKAAASETVRIHRRSARGPLLVRCSHRQKGSKGTFPSRAFHTLASGRRAAYVIDVQVRASDGTVLGTGRQIRQFR
jgi:subtilisin family serine protease